MAVDEVRDDLETCFLCAFTRQPCGAPSVTGMLREARQRDRPGTLELLLTRDDGSPVRIVCGGQGAEQGKALGRLLLTVPADRWRGLRVRALHLAEVADGAFRLLPAGIVVLEPDLLLNITDINNAEYCVRQYPLRRMIPSPPTAPALRGTLVHQAFKELLKGGEQGIAAYLERALHGALPDLALRGLDARELAAEAAPHAQALDAWYARQRESLWSRRLDIRAETFLMAPEVGLKGRLDALLRGDHGATLLELKTGAVRGGASLPKREHRWQVHGYQALLAARAPDAADKPGATILYSGTPGEAQGYGIPFTLRDLHRVVELRNALALVHATGAVPPPPSPAKCGRCMLRSDCQRASLLLGWEPPRLDERPEPVAPEDATAFAALYETLRLEARAAEEETRALWRLAAAERAEAGTALFDLRLEGEPRETASGEWEYTFHTAGGSDLREGDAVLLSDGDPVRGAAVSGSVLRLEANRITVWTPERIEHPALLDHYASDVVHDRIVRNLWRWLRVEPRLRALVRGDVPPGVDSDRASTPYVDLPDTLNPEQREAVARALAARDYLLIQGPPGTGKTSVVSEITRRAVARGERVLVAAFTNQAVDNVLRRLRADGFDRFLRLGHDLNTGADLRDARLVARATARAGEAASLTTELLAETLRTAPVIAATTATWSAERYDEEGEALRFDLAIIDEATQLTTPALLGALRFARRFVLVGDERQLPPLVQSAEAAERGLGRSLFATLQERWGNAACVRLRRQYRMHPVICAFASEAFYEGRLQTDESVLTARLELPLGVDVRLRSLLDPERPVVLLDVPATAREMGRKESSPQALLARDLVVALRRAGVAAAHIGVIAPYRAQVAAIRSRLIAAGEADVLVDTVDRFQGGERDVVIYSFGGQPGPAARRGREFAADPHRLNVALTRARRKLILLGCRKSLRELPLLARLEAYCAGLYDGRGGIIRARPAEPVRMPRPLSGFVE